MNHANLALATNSRTGIANDPTELVSSFGQYQGPVRELLNYLSQREISVQEAVFA